MCDILSGCDPTRGGWRSRTGRTTSRHVRSSLRQASTSEPCGGESAAAQSQAWAQLVERLAALGRAVQQAERVLVELAGDEQRGRAAGGRPHWGKMHTRTAEFFRGAYPRFDDFLAVRDELDPDRVFANDHLDAVLGR